MSYPVRPMTHQGTPIVVAASDPKEVRKAPPPLVPRLAVVPEERRTALLLRRCPSLSPGGPKEDDFPKRFLQPDGNQLGLLNIAVSPGP